MNVTIFVGDVADAPAEAVCTSTNPRLSLMMGTGAAVRGRGGYEILRACEAIVATSGRSALPAGSVHVTTAGALPCKCVIHCVASDTSHRSSDAIVDACVRNAIATAVTAGCKSIAMPVFASGHARMKFDRAITIMAAAVTAAARDLERVYVVVRDANLAAAAVRAFPNAVMEVSAAEEEEPVSLWSMEP